jgi:hypothetical protein
MHFERFQRKISPISNMAFKFHFITKVYLQLAFQAILQQKIFCITWRTSILAKTGFVEIIPWSNSYSMLW